MIANIDNLLELVKIRQIKIASKLHSIKNPKLSRRQMKFVYSKLIKRLKQFCDFAFIFNIIHTSLKLFVTILVVVSSTKY